MLFKAWHASVALHLELGHPLPWRGMELCNDARCYRLRWEGCGPHVRTSARHSCLQRERLGKNYCYAGMVSIGDYKAWARAGSEVCGPVAAPCPRWWKPRSPAANPGHHCWGRRSGKCSRLVLKCSECWFDFSPAIRCMSPASR